MIPLQGMNLEEFSYFGKTLYLPSNCQYLSKLGQGSFGQVICVKKNKNIMAIKIITEEENNDFYISTMREIEILKFMKHPNIIEMFDFYYYKNKIYLILEFMDTNLNNIILSKQKLSKEQVVYFVEQILNGLNALHCSGIIHRDIKPGNILVNKNCLLKIADFGLSCGLDSDLPPEYTVSRWYRAPEILLDCEYNVSSDIWSLGCVFVELINREPLFPGLNTYHQIKKILSFLSDINNSDLNFLEKEKYDYLKKMSYEKNNEPFLKKKGYEEYEKKILSMLSFNPSHRLSANDYLSNNFSIDFFESVEYNKFYDDFLLLEKNCEYKKIKEKYEKTLMKK